uniref:Immediate early response gene 5-like protein n=1 Tax=Cacopsylla melanoneura TaxID=428564 RepID=A0A8D8XS66_9HEMI
MASDAQKLISLSLTKIAQSRSQRKGLSLHKNLLVATVLQKARYIFMEEAYNMIHGPLSNPSDLTSPNPEPVDNDNTSAFNDEVDLIALTEEENNNCSNDNDSSSSSSSSENVPSSSNSDIFNIPSVTDSCSSNSTSSSLNFSENFNSSSHCTVEDKENLEPTTYLDLDKDTDNIILKERSTSPTKSNLKRKRIIAEWETEEAVLSILPKKHRSTSDLDDSVFLDEATLLSPTSSDEESDEGSAMEIDRITSLVSIFSFGGLGGPTSESNKLTRSSSTPDLCSAQAKDQHDLQQRHFLAMTV